MKSNIGIRGYEAEDRSKVFTLLSTFYANINNEKSWGHLYTDNPDGMAIISVAEKLPQKDIIGHYSVIKMPMVIFKRHFLGGKGEGEIFDFSALKQLLRDRTLLNRTTSADLLKHVINNSLKEGIGLVCTNPSDLALKSHLDAGFKIFKQRFDIFVYTFGKKYFAHLLSDKIGTRHISNVVAVVLSSIYMFLHKINVFFYKKSRISLDPIDSFSAATDVFMKKFADRYECITIERKQEHLNWRFVGADYSKFIVRFKDRPIGYIVLHIFTNPNDFKEANLVDYIFLPGYWDKFSAIIVKVLEDVKKKGCDFLRINHMYDFKERLGVSRSIKNLLFLARPDRRNIVVFTAQKLKDLEGRILEADNWYFTDLYFEGY